MDGTTRVTIFPILYHKGKKDELRQWRTWSNGDAVFTEYGTVGGALQVSSKVCVGKNIGKKNETTPEQQASAEAQSQHTFKLERKYSLTKEDAAEPLFLPMLAKGYEPKKHKAENGYYCQPKFDGCRCLAKWTDGKVVLYSRQGKIYDVAHISKELESVLSKDDIFDGELYIHGMPLQQIISLIKKPKEGSENLEYHAYDIPTISGDDSLEFKERLIHINSIKETDHIKKVETHKISTEEDIKKYQEDFLNRGYEGLMLRQENGLYIWGYRSNDLLKVKTWQDSEFEVIDIVEGTGKMTGHAIIECKNDLNDGTFTVVPKVTMEEKKEIFDSKESYIGRKYTVKYFDRTDDNIPRFPIGLAFREDI